jgi:hypothetical protein
LRQFAIFEGPSHQMHKTLIKSIEPSVDWRLVVAWIGLVIVRRDVSGPYSTKRDVELMQRGRERTNETRIA